MASNRAGQLRSAIDHLLAERWFAIGGALTTISGTIAFGLMPITGMKSIPDLSVAILWIVLCGMAVGFRTIVATLKLMVSGEAKPIEALRARVEIEQVVVIFAGAVLLALNLAFFCVIKPQLGQLVNFSADQVLADIDHWLFGADPWTLIGWFQHPGMEIIYHRGWFLWLAFVTLYVLSLPPSKQKDRLLISYMLLWSIFGPLVHLLMPAAGPVFFHNLGLGDRFDALKQAEETQQVALFLWDGYRNRLFQPGGGISAMPSLHLATMFWALIAVRNTRWLAFGLVFTAYIFLGSIAIGWHYAVDGIAGGVGAFACYFLAASLGKVPTRIRQLVLKTAKATA